MDTSPFAMVALQLPPDTAAGVSLQIRTARGEHAWSQWTVVPYQDDEGPDVMSTEGLSASSRVGTYPIFTDAADRLQVRSSTPDLAGIDAVLIDPFGLDRSWPQRVADQISAEWRGTPKGQATARADMPDIVTRAQWGADESLVREQPSYAPSVERAFVHHTVGPNDYTAAQAPGIVRGVMAYHVTSNGWNDIGYNFLVDRFGTIYEGRAGGMTRAVIGAQAGGFNTFSTGVALMGTFSSATPPPGMVDAVARVIAWKADVHHFHPLRTGQATSAGSSRYPSGQVVTLDNVSGHRDVSTTECPGGTTYGQLGAIRQQVRDYAGDLIVDQASDIRRTRVIRGVPDVSSLTVTAELDPPGPWEVTLTDPTGQVVHRGGGEGSQVTSPVDLTQGLWPLGEYVYNLSAAGRLSAEGTVTFDPPQITNLGQSSLLATADAGGDVIEPVAFHADLWDQASWELSVSDPGGTVVFTQSGVGESLDTGWFHGVTDPGTYLVRVSAEDAEPVQTSLEVRYDLLDRVADTDDPIQAGVLLSGATFVDGTADRAVIARHDVFADALAGGPLAGTEGPLLLTTPDDLDAAVRGELDRVLAADATVYVLGGSSAISDAVVAELTQRYGDVVRLSGANRVGVAAAVA
ncbi:MAG: N-acetylmuramoyl-L-alanine amidase [Euzebya sp.]